MHAVAAQYVRVPVRPGWCKARVLQALYNKARWDRTTHSDDPHHSPAQMSVSTAWQWLDHSHVFDHVNGRELELNLHSLDSPERTLDSRRYDDRQRGRSTVQGALEWMYRNIPSCVGCSRHECLAKPEKARAIGVTTTDPEAASSANESDE